jgi:hypothetical protein
VEWIREIEAVLYFPITRPEPRWVFLPLYVIVHVHFQLLFISLRLSNGTEVDGLTPRLPITEFNDHVRTTSPVER